MAEVSAQLVKTLRDQTGAGMMDCKKALNESGGDLDKAIEYLRKKGMKDIGKRADRVAAEGVVHAYIHAGGRIGVMVELNSETDFVARSDDFQNLVKGIAMHIAWASPRFLDRASVSADILNTEREIFRAQLKPGQEKMADKIIEGKLEKFFEENCLLEQLDVRDSTGKKKIGDLINEVGAKVGEKVVLRRFVRYEVGEGIDKPITDFAEEVRRAASGH